jgi:hypothetical protein
MPRSVISLWLRHVGELARLLEASGAFRHHPQRRASRLGEPMPAGPLGDPPDWLNQKERVCWAELVDGALPGVLAKSDRIALAAMSVLYASIKARKTNAAAYSQFRRYQAEFGMTAASRANVSVPPTERENPFADI